MKERQYDTALSHFVAAQKILPRNKEILFYKSSAIIIPLTEILTKEQLSLSNLKARLTPIIEELSSVIAIHSKSDHFLRFYRGIAYLYVQEFEKAMVDIRQAIKNNEESNAKYHMFLGIAYGCMNLLKEAIKDLTIAIKLKDDYLQAYYNRGKCAYLLGNADLAFTDFQKLLLIKPVGVFSKV